MILYQYYIFFLLNAIVIGFLPKKDVAGRAKKTAVLQNCHRGNKTSFPHRIVTHI